MVSTLLILLLQNILGQLKLFHNYTIDFILLKEQNKYYFLSLVLCRPILTRFKCKERQGTVVGIAASYTGYSDYNS